ncbi:MAG: hypothetical protein Q9218_005297 [Villophora microphyllina]
MAVARLHDEYECQYITSDHDTRPSIISSAIKYLPTYPEHQTDNSSNPNPMPSKLASSSSQASPSNQINRLSPLGPQKAATHSITNNQTPTITPTTKLHHTNKSNASAATPPHKPAEGTLTPEQKLAQSELEHDVCC